MIYIVEDDSAIRELEQYALQSNGYEAVGFESSEPFWQAVHTTPPELVILDVMLPGEDGFSILKKLRAAPSLRRLPIIMITAKSSELDTVRGLDCGADDYITKPFGIMEFLSRVRAALRRAEPEARPNVYSFRAWMALRFVVRFVRKRIHRSSWYLRKKMILTRSEDSDLGLMTI